MSRRFGVIVALGAAVALGACDRTVAGGKADGAAIFAEVCARCHGAQGVPDSGQVARLGVKDLTTGELHDRLSDVEISSQIRNGSKNHNMPAFAGALTADQIAAVISHVRTLRR